MPIKADLIAAIENRSVLRFTYNRYPRVVEPHAVGRSTAGHDVLRCWQTEGGSEKGVVPAWKLMLLSDIRGLVVTEVLFKRPREGYVRGDSAMRDIYAELR